MKLWKKASGSMKDQKRIWISSLAARRTSLRNPKIEAAVIKSTSHDELSMDTRSIAFLYRLLRLSPSHQRPILYAISIRMEKTTSWVVALKGLLLMHGIFACKVPFIQKIGSLPFDLSYFTEGSAGSGKRWAHNKFITSYYDFLDKKSEFLCHNVPAISNKAKSSLKNDFLVIQKLQVLLDMLLEIRPQTEAMKAHPLFIEAVDCVLVEIFDVYSQICRGISRFLVRMCSIGQGEAVTALKIIQKAASQGEDLSMYFDICREIGVMNASDCPRIDKIPKEDMQDLEDIINGAIAQKKKLNEENQENDSSKQIVVRDPHQVALINDKNENFELSKINMTIITHDWVTFDEDISAYETETSKGKDPFEDFMVLALPPPQICSQCHDLPDLISL